MIRVALADDDLLIREGIQRLLEAEPAIEVVAVAADSAALLEAVEHHVPDVVLTDVKLPPGYATEGIELARALRRSQPKMGVIVVSSFAELRYALALLADGTAGRGYLLKDRLAHRDQLATAITQVAAGGSVIDPKLVDLLVTRGEGDAISPLHRLTQREHEVLAELASGKSNAAIGRDLVITKRAVERHVGAIFAKLDLPDQDAASRRVAAALVFLAETEPGTALDL
jgi:DNA-binding NarL/FixJ family response regulator